METERKATEGGEGGMNGGISVFLLPTLAHMTSTVKVMTVQRCGKGGWPSAADNMLTLM